MYLERILGTGTKVNALNTLVNNPEKRFVEKDLAAATGSAVSEINRQMPDLVNSGIVRLERIGKNKLYSINSRHFLFKELRTLFTDLNVVFLKAAKQISAQAVLHGAKTVILIGSVARRAVRSDIIKTPSDIDLVFLVEKTDKKNVLYSRIIEFVGKEISRKYGFLCYPVILTIDEYLDALKKDEAFIVRIQAEGVELYGRKPRRFG